MPSEKQGRMTKEKFDLLSIPYFSIKKGASRGARHGKSEEQCAYHQAVQCLRKVKKNHFGSVLERVQTSRLLSRIANADTWTNSYWMEDKSCTATRRERQRYEKNWKLMINALVNKRNDYLEAVRTMKGLRQQADQPKKSSDSAELPDLTKAIQRASSIRGTKMEVARLGQIHVLLPHQQLGGLPLLVSREWQER